MIKVMLLIKKLLFVVPFLLLVTVFLNQLGPLLQDPKHLLSLSTDILVQLALLIAYILLTSLLFTVFATLANDWKIVIPVLFLAAALPLFMTEQPVNASLALGILVALASTYGLFFHTLATYLSFQPVNLLAPTVERTATFILLAIAIVYFQASAKDIRLNGFEVPESFVGSILQLIPTQELTPASQNLTRLSIQEQQSVVVALTKQIQDLLVPYLPYIPIILSVSFFATAKMLLSLETLAVAPLLWLFFLVLAKIGFTHYVTEQREVKKLTL